MVSPLLGLMDTPIVRLTRGCSILLGIWGLPSLVTSRGFIIASQEARPDTQQYILLERQCIRMCRGDVMVRSILIPGSRALSLNIRGSPSKIISSQPATPQQGT